MENTIANIRILDVVRLVQGETARYLSPRSLVIYLLYLICCWCVYPICVLVMSGHIKNNKYHILTEYMTVSLNHQQISMRFEMIHYHTVMICNRHEFVTRKILTLTHRHLLAVHWTVQRRVLYHYDIEMDKMKIWFLHFWKSSV
jgi:hypothetical protein